MARDHNLITTEAELEALYGQPSPVSLSIERDHIHPHYKTLIEASSFMILATVGPGGMDASPRGDPRGFVHVVDEKTILIPDRRGNNRLDSMRNLVQDDRVGMLFLIPGVVETLRVNGRAKISVAPDLIARFPFNGTLPKSVLVVTVEQAFFHCPKSLIRSDLWNPEKYVDRSTLPSVGTILHDLTGGKVGGSDYDREYPQRMRQAIY